MLPVCGQIPLLCMLFDTAFTAMMYYTCYTQTKVSVRNKDHMMKCSAWAHSQAFCSVFPCLQYQAIES